MAFKTKIEDSFEDRSATILLGLASWAYLFYHFTAEKSAVRVLPVMKPMGYGILFSLMLGLQVFVWIYFRHFGEKWYLKFRIYFYFFVELGVLLFSIGMAFWPFFLLFRSKLI